VQYVKFALMGFGALAAILGLSASILSFGGHGILVFVCCLVPVGLGAMTLVTKKGMPRWASIVSLVALLVAAMKTSEGSAFENIMMAAAAGMVCALVLAIKPDKGTAGAAS